MCCLLDLFQAKVNKCILKAELAASLKNVRCFSVDLKDFSLTLKTDPAQLSWKGCSDEFLAVVVCGIRSVRLLTLQREELIEIRGFFTSRL